MPVKNITTRKMTNRLLTALLVPLSLLVCLSALCQTGFSVKTLDSGLTALSQSGQFNGTVLYAENGKILYKKAFGVADIVSGKPLTTASSFNLASISKQFITMGILQLAETGKLTLDDAAVQYIPQLPYPTVTVRQMLTHTSGIPEYFDIFQHYRGTLDTLDNESLVAMFAKLKPTPDFAPGTAWNYCNTNYVLLASIIERIAKQNIHDYLQQHLFAPLGMKDTYVYNVLMRETPANHVLGFEEVNGRKKLADLTNLDGVVGDGNIYSSVEDLFIWEQSLYTATLVKKEILAQAFEPVKLNDGSTHPYGFAWFIAKPGEQYWHTGSWVGFKNLIYRDVAQKRTLIVLGSGTSPAGRLFAKALFEGKPFDSPKTMLFTNVRLVDGTGTNTRNANVRIQGDKIIAVGDLKPFPGEDTLNGGGNVLAPGFIDSHSHLAGSFGGHPDALAAVSQGVTTIVSGQDGDSDPIDTIKAHIQKTPIAINVATYTGHTSLRAAVMGENNLSRVCTEDELAKMKILLKVEMDKGSLGFSSGLEYAGAYFSSRHEVIELAKVAGAANGRYISHIRSEDVAFDDAIDEIISIGREAKLPVQISHIKIALKDSWGTSNQLLAQLEAARQQGINITADCYPYTYWHSTIRVLFPKTDYTNLQSAQFAVDHTFDANKSVLNRFAPNLAYQGKTIAAIAAMRNETPAQTLISLIAITDTFEKAHPEISGVEGIVASSMSEDDVANLLAWPNTNICSDGANGGHPRGYGTFTRVLGYYVRQQKIMRLETAIQKMTSLSAEHVGLQNRGIIAPGYFADLVLFNPETVIDKATITNSKALSDGILKVWVNGKLVYADKKVTGERPGEFLGR
jgi:N-acyl-D-aspartate/D-glutamate deacylase/CubicO group peptidase (beta-lactamase class C family)